MNPPRAAQRRVPPSAFIVALILMAGLALVGTVAPWLNCRTCGGEAGRYRNALRNEGHPWANWLMRCISCKDQGKVTLVGWIAGVHVDPLLADFSKFGHHGAERGLHLDMLGRLMQTNGIAPQEGLLSGQHVFNWVNEGFIQSGLDAWFIVALSGNEETYGGNDTYPFPGRVFLFNLRGRLIDRLEIGDANHSTRIRFHVIDQREEHDPLFEVRVCWDSELSQGVPADVDLTQGTTTRRLYSGLREYRLNNRIGIQGRKLEVFE